MITLEDYKSYAEINSPNSDTKLTALVEYVNNFVSKYCGTKFSPTIVLGEKHEVFGNLIVLKNAPIISVEGILLDGRELPIDYVELEEGIVTLVRPLNGLRASVDYTYGHESIPGALKIACFELITYFNKREFNKSKSLAGENITYLDPSVIPPHVRAAFDLYRVV